jgi:2-polyprenyl-3-methyl-5-hydroxy-6-metoxy-1,4-benzoquinol methylase
MSDLKTRLKASYDAVAPTYNTWAASNCAVRLRFLDRLLALLPAAPGDDSAVLDALELGCGAGIPVTQILLSAPGGRKFNVTANDLSSTQIALAKETLGEDGVCWVQGDMMGLEFAKCSFDIVVALYSVIHLPRTEQEILMKRIAGWLKPGGLILVNFGTEEAEEDISENWMGAWMFSSGWGTEVTLKKVEEAGLEVVAGEVAQGDGVRAEFLWVIARRGVSD